MENRARTVRSTLACTAFALIATTACTPTSADEGTAEGPGASRAAEVAPAGTAHGGDALDERLDAIRSATAKYRDVSVAVEDGYVRDPMDLCVTAEMEGHPRRLGGMGLHYFRPDLLGLTGEAPRVTGVGTHEDFLQPGVLVYEPQPDGSLELVAVENLIFAEAWRERHGAEPPEFAGHPYHHLVDDPRTDVDEAHGFAPHYELHLWIFRENPAGVSAPFNTEVSCEHHR